MFLTMALALTTMFASAQFMVVTTMTQPADGESFGMSNITENMGVGYVLNDKMTLGVVKNGDAMDLWGRYNLGLAWLTMQAPTDSITEAANIGVGYSLKIWNSLYIEPNYSMSMKENSGGTFKIGMAYRF